ncbi:MAG: triose-phosphate isomerase [Candidatus Andersenbacteria bacterium]|nr:triose-phosphate isomerase [Candidatus Andersenbacteria bacterium]
MERGRLVVGNWKMELSHKGECEVARSLKRQLASRKMGVEIVVCPSFPSLPAVSELMAGVAAVSVGAQNVSAEETGAQTGAVSVSQIAPFAHWCIVGHSEVRARSGAGDEQVQAAMSLLLSHGILPIVCIGESREEREADAAVDKIEAQMTVLLNKLTRTALTRLVVAYEPIWAISSQQPDSLPDPDEVTGIMLLIRKLAAARFGSEAAQRLRVVYGGSVTADTVNSFVAEPGVDGVLVGSASVRPRELIRIAEVVAQARGSLH